MTTRRLAHALSLLALASPALAQLCPVVHETNPSLGFVGPAGSSLGYLGDLDGDGTVEVMVGFPDPASSAQQGFQILSVTQAPDPAPGTISIARTYALPGEVSSDLDGGFGAAIALLGDLGSNGSLEVAVGAPGENHGTGAVYIFSVDPVTLDFTLETRLSGATLGLGAGDAFGSALAGLPDLGGGKSMDLFVGAPGCDDGGTDNGALWVLDLDAALNLLDDDLINATNNALPGMSITGGFGSSITTLTAGGASSDLDGNGTSDLVVGAPDEAGGGALWVLFFLSDGTLDSATHIKSGENGFTGGYASDAGFGRSVVTLSAGAGACERMLAVGAPSSDEWTGEQGELWYLCLGTTGYVFDELRVSASSGGFGGFLGGNGHFGSALSAMGDLDGNGANDLLVGAPGASDAIWTLFHASTLQPRTLSFGPTDHADLQVTAGAPTLGGSVTVSLEDPSSTVPSGATLVYCGPLPVATAPDGLPVGGMHGELLIDLASASVLGGPIWDGLTPAQIVLPVPLDPSLAGTSHFVQGTIFGAADTVMSNGQRLVLAF